MVSELATWPGFTAALIWARDWIMLTTRPVTLKVSVCASVISTVLTLGWTKRTLRIFMLSQGTPLNVPAAPITAGNLLELAFDVSLGLGGV